MKHLRLHIVLPLLLVLLPVLSPASTTIASPIRNNLWVTNGPISHTATVGNTLYINGRFTTVSPSTGTLVAVDAQSGARDTTFPQFGDNTNAIVSDGSGGWYIGSRRFTSDSFSSLSHIRADKTIDATWHLSPYSVVNTLVLSGGKLFIGGEFAQIDGQARNNLAALDVATGMVTAWNPNADGEVTTMAVYNTRIYIGGTFHHVSGLERPGFTGLDSITGQPIAQPSGWDFKNSTTNSLLVHGNTLYVGGSFETTDSYLYDLIALDIPSNAITSWSPGTFGPAEMINALAAVGNTLYIGGYFSAINGQQRHNLAALDMTTAVPTSWNPNVDGIVTVLIATNGIIYAGGTFASVDGVTRTNVAALDSANGIPTPWAPNPNDGVLALAIQSGTIYLGGFFSGLGGITRHNLAALDLATGEPTAWSPVISGIDEGDALTANANTVYISGFFQLPGDGYAQGYIVAYDAITGVTRWAVRTRGSADVLVVSGNRVYAGGESFTIFNSDQSQFRRGVAAFEADTGTLTSWSSDIEGYVDNLAVRGNTVYIGGHFSTTGGEHDTFLAAIDAITGSILPWTSGVDAPVRVLMIEGNTLYVGGAFTHVGGEHHPKVAAIDTTTNSVTSWEPHVDEGFFSAVYALATSGGSLYIGGPFTSVGGQPRDNLAAIDIATGKLMPWVVQNDSLIDTLIVSDNTLYASGGSFVGDDGHQHVYLAGITLAPVLVTNAAQIATATSATLFGSIATSRSDTVVIFQISTTAGDYTHAITVTATPFVASNTPPINVSATVDDLTPSTTYYYRIAAINGADTTIGNERSFATVALGQPNYRIFLPVVLRRNAL